VLNKGGIKMESKVKWFNNEKGYGFIEYKENEDIFVHYSQILQDGYKSLNQGDNVYFELIETDKGFQAKNVQASRNVM
jgi:CspA family cold shock protein